jgi:hypothetical protein
MLIFTQANRPRDAASRSDQNSEGPVLANRRFQVNGRMVIGAQEGTMRWRINPAILRKPRLVVVGG